ncbi:MAG TPA: hypothetical protein VGQ57_19285 [Polyangiaceae bacterium]|jgi:hypothetical protein|nr:hypothetical protein [Polyangiaceae bacterium]
MAFGRTTLFGAALGWLTAVMPRAAQAQACCAGTSAVTPGRLELHEDALVGVRVRVATLLGRYDAHAEYRGAPAGTAQWDFEQALFGSLRVLRRGQLSLLVPLAESWRRTPTTGAEFGGGLGDLNVSARYDFTGSHEVSFLPGIALLLGTTLPTGRSPEAASSELGSDATGVGAVQLNAGLALERSFGSWLFGATGLVAKRFPRDARGVKSDLGTQLTFLANAGYVFESEASLAAVVTFTTEGKASVDDHAVPGSARRLLEVGLAGSQPLDDAWRLQASAFLHPPVDRVGKNQPAMTGAAVTVVWAFR